VHVIDLKQSSHWRNIASGTLERAGLEEMVSFHDGPAHEVLPALRTVGTRVQVAFIEGWHMLD
jgi:hypothetical protein